jgi:hypothetical protein
VCRDEPLTHSFGCFPRAQDEPFPLHLTRPPEAAFPTAVKALILAKFLLLGRMLHVGTRFRDKPLIWPTLYHALMFLIVLLILTTLEELIVGPSTVGRSPTRSLTWSVRHSLRASRSAWSCS